MCGMPRQTTLAEQSGYICLHLEKSFKAKLGYDPIQNKVGEGYKIREESDR